MASSERSHKKSDRSDEENKQRSIENQQHRASKESAKVLENLIGNSENYLSKLSNQWLKSRRLPRRYYINNNQTELLIIQGDITRIKVDAIVNAANEQMIRGSGVDGIVHRAAGPDLHRACTAHKQITPGVRLPSGQSRILLSYNMSPTTYYIINTAGPVYSSYVAEECAKDLSSCYRTALALANLYNLESIAFTAISCGIFGYPPDDGAEVALRTVDKEANSMPVVVFVLWDDHIYDAWIKKAEELGFTSLDNNSTATAKTNLSKQLNNDDKSKSTGKTRENNDKQVSQSIYNPKIIDASSPNGTENAPDPSVESSFPRLPSVPHGETYTQQTAEVEENNDTTIDNSPSNTQKTCVTNKADMEMADANQKEETKTTNNASEQQSVQKEGDKSDDKTLQTETVPRGENNLIVSKCSKDND